MNRRFGGYLLCLLAGALAGATTAYPAGVATVWLCLMALSWAMQGTLISNAARLFIWIVAYMTTSLGWMVWALQTPTVWGYGWSAVIVITMVAVQALIYASSYLLLDVLVGFATGTSSRRTDAGRKLSGLMQGLMLGLSVTAAELVRMVWDFGSTWGSVGYSQVDNPLMRGAFAMIGTPGVAGVLFMVSSFSVALISAARAWAESRSPSTARSLVVQMASLAIPVAALGAVALMTWTEPNGTPVKARLVHTALPEGEKYEIEAQHAAEALLLELAKMDDVRLTLFPELFLVNAPYQYGKAWRQSVMSAVRSSGNHLLVGSPELKVDSDRRITGLTNSIIELSPVDNGKRRAKEKLIPFTEQLTDNPIIEWVFSAFETYPNSNFVPGGVGQVEPFAIGQFLVSGIVCSEVMSPPVYHARGRQADIMFSASSESWVVNPILSGLIIQATKARALESQKWLVRSGNVGPSGVTQDQGQWQESGNLHTKVELQARRGSTPFTRFSAWLYSLMTSTESRE